MLQVSQKENNQRKKSCPACKQTLPIEHFGLRKNGKPRSYCRECNKAYQKRQYASGKVFNEKKCPACGLIKETTEYPKYKRYAPPYCKECKRKWEHNNYHLETRHDRILQMNQESNRLLTLIVKEKLRAYLTSNPCVDCGETDLELLEFDHIDPKKKEHNVSRLIGRSSWHRIEKEILKCRVVCISCHRKRTAKQQNWFTRPCNLEKYLGDEYKDVWKHFTEDQY
jgi:transposase-like protein